MKPEDHAIITGKAVEVFVRARLGDGSIDFARHRGAINKGSAREDLWPPVRRAANWHFYRADPEMRPGRVWCLPFITVYPYSEKVLAGHIARLKQRAVTGKPPSRGAMILAGRILHHVQDMSTPSHVTPVYHAVKTKDRYEEYSRDHIDELVHRIKLGSNELAAVAGEEPMSLMGLYHDSAERSRRILGDPDRRFAYTFKGQPRQGGWELFWVGHKEGEGSSGSQSLGKRGFGRFGPPGAIFGTDQAGEYDHRADPAVYEGVYLAMMKKMLADSLRCLRSLERELSPRPAGY